MIVLDANLLLYAVNSDAALNGKAKAWLESVLGGSETVGISWSVLLAFLRLSTRHGLFARPLGVEPALDLVDAWLAQPNVTVIHPGPQHRHLLRGLLLQAGTGGNLTSDAHLAAVAMEYGAVLCSTDHDFARFAGLKWRNPLA